MLELDEGGAGVAGATRLPTPCDLRAVLEGGWIQEGRGGAPATGSAADWRVVADASPHLIVKRHADGRPSAAVVGARTRWVDVDPRRDFTVVFRLRPGGLPLLTGLPGTDLVDRSACLEEQFGVAAAAPILDAAAVGDVAGVVARSHDLVRRRTRSGAVVDWRVRGLLARHAVQPGRAAVDMGVADRTLRDAVRAAVGISPGRVARIRRLQRALRAKLEGRVATWSAAAAEAGFHDHAHLVRECRTFLGEPPGTFADRGRRGPLADGRTALPPFRTSLPGRSGPDSRTIHPLPRSPECHDPSSPSPSRRSR